MPVVKSNEIKLESVSMDNAKHVTKANTIGPAQGWPGHSMRVFRISPGGHTPFHQHDYEHVNYFVRGKGILTLDGEKPTVEANDHAYVPPNVEHQFENPFDEDLEFLCIVPIRGA